MEKSRKKEEHTENYQFGNCFCVFKYGTFFLVVVDVFIYSKRYALCVW